MKQAVKKIIAALDRLPPLQRQVARFIVTGGANTVFAYLVYAAFAVIFGMGYAQALLFSWCIGVLFSYLTFRAFVFTGGARGLGTFARFLPTYVVLLGINMAALHVLVAWMGWHKLLAQAVIVPFCAALSFVINRLFVFREKAA